MIKFFSSLLFLCWLAVAMPVVPTFASNFSEPHPVEQLLGENLEYDISFLWFERLAEGSIRLQRGDKPGRYLAIMEARTLGIAAFLTRDRVEKYQTLMEVGPKGLLRPLVHSTHKFKGKGDKQQEKRTTYTFDFANRKVHYHKNKSQKVESAELLLLETEGSVYDILSAFYNLRLGAFGPFDKQTIHIPTLHRKGAEDIIVSPVSEEELEKDKFFHSNGAVCRVLVDPSVFKTKGRELFISLDENNRLERGIIKNVIGLGDVKGVLRND